MRDFAQVRADGRINREVADAALAMRDIDADGFDEMDKRVIEALIHKFAWRARGAEFAVRCRGRRSRARWRKSTSLISSCKATSSARRRAELPCPRRIKKLGLKVPGGQGRRAGGVVRLNFGPPLPAPHDRYAARPRPWDAIKRQNMALCEIHLNAIRTSLRQDDLLRW